MLFVRRVCTDKQRMSFNRTGRRTMSLFMRCSLNYRVLNLPCYRKCRGSVFYGSGQPQGQRLTRGRPKSTARDYTGPRQITGSAFHRVAPNQRLGISQGPANLVGQHITGSRQLLGTAISRGRPHYRGAHFKGTG